MKKLLLAFGIICGIAAKSEAVIISTYPATYQSPKYSTATGYAVMWLTGTFEFHRSTGNSTAVVVISSTGGVQSTIGIVTTTATITGMLTGAQASFSSWITASSATFSSTITGTVANFSSWITASSATFSSTMTASNIVFSSSIINGVSYVWPSSQGSASTILTNNGSGTLSWASAAAPSFSNAPRDYDVILGTDGAQGVDFANSTASLTLAELKVNGSSSVITGIGFSAIMRSGVYNICSATIPAGMSLFASYGTSVTVMIPNSSTCTWNIYGKVEGIDFDYRSLAYVHTPLQIGTGGSWKNSTIYRADGMTGGILGKIFRVENSTNVKINATIDKTAIPTAVSWQGDGNICVINKSTDVDIVLNSRYITAFTSQAGLLLIRASTRVDLHDSFWEQMGGYHVILIGENIDCSVRNNKGMIVGTDNGNGSISFDNPGAAQNGVSSGCVVSGNYFEERSGGSTTVFDNAVGANNFFFNNTIVGRGASTKKGFTVGSASNGTILQMNRVLNRAGSAMTFITDGGSGTIYQTQGNILDKTAQ